MCRRINASSHTLEKLFSLIIAKITYLCKINKGKNHQHQTQNEKINELINMKIKCDKTQTKILKLNLNKDLQA